MVTLRGFWAALPRAGRWLLATVLVGHLGRGLTLPFTAVYLTEGRHFSYDTTGTLMGLVAMVALAVLAPGGPLIDRYGARVVMIVAHVCQLVGLTVLAWAATVPRAALAFVLIGVTYGLVWPAAQALGAAVVSGPLRQQYFAANFALINAGIGVGGIVAGLFVDVHDVRTFVTIYLADAAFTLVPLFVLLGPLRRVHGRADHPPEGHEHRAHARGYLTILRRPSMGWLTALTAIGSLVGYGMMEVGLPGFARQVSEVSTRVLGFAFAANTVVIVVVQFLVMRLIHGRRRTRVLMVMSGIWALSWLMLGSTAFVAGGPLAAAGVIAYLTFFGVGETLLQPTIPAMVNDLAPDHLRGRYNAVSSSAFQVGAIAAPVLAGTLLEHGWAGVLVGVCVGGCLLMIVLARAVEGRVSPTVNGLIGDEVVAQGPVSARSPSGG